MYRLRFRRGVLRKFMREVAVNSQLSTEALGQVAGVSGRTVRKWIEEKYLPDEVSLKKLSSLTNIQLPPHTKLNNFWYVRKGASLGGKTTFLRHGPLGDVESRRKGGLASWQKRKADPALLEKYTKQFTVPPFSSELAEFVGIMLGDGGMTKYQVTITLHKSLDKDFITYVKKLCKTLFGVAPKVYDHTNPINKNVQTICFSGVNIVSFLVSIGLVIGNKVRQQARVPEWILGDNDYKMACLRGLVDTDGCIFTHKYRVGGKEYAYKKIAFTNRSLPLLQFVHGTCLSLGMRPFMMSDVDVRLTSKRDVSRYMQIVGTNNPKHLKRFQV